MNIKKQFKEYIHNPSKGIRPLHIGLSIIIIGLGILNYTTGA